MSLMSTDEQPVRPPSEPSTSTGGFKAYVSALRSFPSPCGRVFTIQVFAWFAWFSLFIFGTLWMAETVYGGAFFDDAGNELDDSDPRKAAYETGVRMGNLGLALQALTAIFYSCMLPSLTRRFTRKYCYIFSQVVLGASLLSMLFLDEGQNALAVFLFAVLGIPWATTMTIPWTIVALAVSHLSTVGLYLTTFNLSQCFPEILVSLIGEVIIAETDAPALVLALGGVSALVSAALIPVLGATDLSMLDHTLSDEESNPPLSRVRLHSFPPSVPQATTDAGFDAPMGYDGEHTSPTTRSRVQPIERSGISPSPSPSSSPTAPLIHSSLPRRTE
eukprot:Rmarinus@m.5581